MINFQIEVDDLKKQKGELVMLAKYYDSMLNTSTRDLLDPFKIFDDIYSTTLSNHTNITKSSLYRVNTTEDGMTLSLDIPGVKSKDLSVQVTGRDVKVTGKLRGDEFKQLYRISKDYDPDTVDAQLEDGVLTLSFKKISSAVTKNIEVKVK